MKVIQLLHVFLLLLSIMSVSSFNQPTKSFNRVINNISTCQSNNKQIQHNLKSMIEITNDSNKINKNLNKIYSLSNKDISSPQPKHLSLSIQLLFTITLSLTNKLPAHALSASPAEEAVQLLYGYQTNIPSAITWFVMLYGAYKIYFGIFRWLASM